MRMPRLISSLVLACALSGCAQAARQAGPVLVSFQDRQRATIEPAVNTNTYGSIADRLAALPAEVYAGSEIQIAETVLNDGRPSRGVRLLVKGSALSGGLLGLPREACVVGSFLDKNGKNERPDDRQSCRFSETAGGWSASMPAVSYGSQLSINMQVPAVKGGSGDIQIYVYPLDTNGRSSAVIAHNYKILDEQESNNEVPVPTDN